MEISNATDNPFGYAVNRDDRGLLAEIYSSIRLKSFGFDEFCQANVSLTIEPGVVRGLHFQLPPNSQNKYIVVLQGAIYNVQVDLGIKNFGKVSACQLEAFSSGCFVPDNFAHGFQSLASNTILVWFMSKPFDNALARSIRFDDPQLGINWPLSVRSDLLSRRDQAAQKAKTFCDIFK